MAPCVRQVKFSGRQAPSLLPPEVEAEQRKLPNKVCTTRFTLISWLPKSLYFQFHRSANIYFAVVCVLVCLPFSPVMWSSTVLPFVGVLVWTALKDMFEDMRRKRDDDLENYRFSFRFNFGTGLFEPTQWQKIQVGDLILSLQDEAFPADMLILATAAEQAYISTANLDGETNLKERRPPDILSLLQSPQVGDIDEGGSATPAGQQTPVSHVSPRSNAVSTFRLPPTENQNRESPGPGTHKAGPDALTMAACEAGVELVGKITQFGLEAQLDEPKIPPTAMGGAVVFSAATEEFLEQMKASQVDKTSHVQYDHFVPRGCVLRNTPWLLAMVAYVGGETKSQLNQSKAEGKVSSLQIFLNYSVRGLVVCLTIFCLYAAIMGQALGTDKPGADFVKRFCIYWIILYQVVPVSLYVVFEVVKLLLGALINRDQQMMDPATGINALARTADLVEELGQVEYVFSDKTGTLTQNEMRFARCWIAGQDPGDFRPQGAQRGSPENYSGAVVAAPAPGVTVSRQIMGESANPASKAFGWFFLCMAVCHDAQVEDSGDKQVYSGSSPDEVAFLEAANEAGVALKGRKAARGSSGAELAIHGPNGPRIVKVLSMVPFNSDRKRMTVLCFAEGEYHAICKGADTTMLPLCASLPAGCEDQLRKYALQGLRTMVTASKALEPQFAEGWKKRFEAARADGSDQRESRLAFVASELESSMSFVGVTAIEDRLQDGVPEAIATLRNMGIKVWVLTGDKMETAIEIARSCQLLDNTMTLVRLGQGSKLQESAEEVRKDLQDRVAEISKLTQGALVIDGTYLGHICSTLSANNEGLDLLYQIGSQAVACVCCRLAPQQKRLLVEMVQKRSQGRITLAIGDGANDVPMIQGAHVGIAVRGKEGSQAVQACDVAVSQFRFLVPLLLCHGRRAYRRVSLYLCYFLYKHVVLAMGDVIWAHYNSFAGQIAYPEWLSSAYPILITALPIIIVTVMDQDVPDQLCLQSPKLYSEGIQRIHFNGPVFVSWIVSATYHGLAAWLVPHLVLNPTKQDQLFWIASVAGFTLVVLFVTIRLWISAMNPFSPPVLGIFAFSLLVYLTVVLVLGQSSLGSYMQPLIAGVPFALVTNGSAIGCVLITPLVLLLDLGVIMTLSYVRPSPITEVRRLVLRSDKTGGRSVQPGAAEGQEP